MWGAQVTSSNSAGVYARTAGQTVNAYNGGVVYGNLGVGTATPAYRLDVAGSVNGTGLCIAGDCKTSWAQVSGGTATTVGAVNVSSGQFGANVGGGNFSFPAGVGIGMLTPGAGYKLDVNGDERVTGAVSTTGAITAGGAITGVTVSATYQDVAEWVPSTQRLAAGTVVVLDTERDNHVVGSTRAYDTGVAGVVSDSPGGILGVGVDGKVKVATTGRVRVKVDATRSPIRVGDLLVTSDVEGVAMKSVEVDLGGVRIHRPGTIIGKALEPLASGTGEILVLLSLQ